MAYLAGLLANVLKEKQEKDIKMIKKNTETVKKELQEKQDELINEKDILCVQIAALCYNLGHGPFSHLFEKFISKTQPDGNTAGQEDNGNDQPGTVKNWKRASIWIFLDIVQKNDELKQELDQNDLTFIKTLIEGKSEGTQYPNKTFLYDIVENTWNGIDVRRWDYFARDCHYLGIQNSFDHQCLLKSARVCVADGKKHICFRDKVADNVYDMFHTRYMLYLQAYQHRTANSIKENIVEALIQAKDTLEITPISESITDYNITKKIENIKRSSQKRKSSASEDGRTAKFIKLTDHVFERILYNDELIGAQQELEDVIKRRLPKCVGETRLAETEKEKFQENWNKVLEERKRLYPAVFLDERDFSIDVIKLDYKIRDVIGDPIDAVHFYRKNDHTKTCKIEKYEVSSLHPKKFTEYMGRVYCTSKSDNGNKAKDCFKWWRHGVILLYDRENFEGNCCVTTGDCPAVYRRGIIEVRSCKVLSGVWELCEGRDYKEPKYQVQPGREFCNPQNWSDNNSTASAQSVRRMTE